MDSTQTSAALLSFLLFLFISPSACVGHAAELCKASEREALLQFKNGVDSNDMLSSWIAGGDCCKWAGIVCNNRTGHVTEIDLSPIFFWRNDTAPPPLSGRISPSLVSLRYLQRLDLSFNNFTGEIPPQLGNLSSLQALDLSYSQGQLESDGEWLANLSSLQFLGLSWVNLSKAARLFQVLNKLPFLSSIALAACDLDPASLSVSSNANFSRLWLLDLSFNSMEFRLPRWLLNTTSLEILYLDYNDILHYANEFAGNLCNLRSLSLSTNNMAVDLGHFFMGCDRRLNLEYLDLRSNYITGKLPEWLGDYKHLNRLDLSYNSLSGSIPESTGGMVSLQYMDLSQNNLSGFPPPSLWKLQSLQHLDLSGNDMHGSFSEKDFRNQPNLTFLDLSSNSFQLAMPSSWIPPFSLHTLRIGSCKVGPGFPLWLQTQVNLSELNMSNAGISDVLPQWIWNFSSKLGYIYLSGNMLKGAIPPGMNLTSIVEAYLESNKFEGSLPSLPRDIGILSLSNNSFSGPLILDGLSDPIILSLSGNNLSGPVPPTLCNYTGTLEMLDLSNNHLSGQLPPCLGALDSSCEIQTLLLGNNNLQGILPASLQYCTSMYVLDVRNNRFSGDIPSWIFANMSGVRVLSLRSNLFYGSIPPQMSDLTSLQVLDLSNNNFSGSIPPIFDNFTVMLEPGSTRTRPWSSTLLESIVVTNKGTLMEISNALLQLYVSIDLSGNRLSGEIPGAIGSLHGLITLNLSQNQFHGLIPDSFGALSQLESLDLSRNNLSGTIPQSLTRLSFLSEFNVSFNHLSGSIPSGQQFPTFSTSSYMGNLLCGKPLEACDNNHPSSSEDAKNDNSNGDESIWLYVSIIFGFIVGFWTFFGSLIFKRSWRHSYIRFIDKHCERCYICIFNMCKKSSYV